MHVYKQPLSKKANESLSIKLQAPCVACARAGAISALTP